MKAEELMIGDWVISKKRGKDEILQVVTIDGGSNTVWLDGGYSGLVKGDDIFPIQITPEILKANGITLKEVGDNGPATPPRDRNRLEKWMIHTTWKDAKLWYDRLTMCWHLQDMTAAQFRHVHELQHALRMIGLTDFADNFVIKEGGER